MKNRLDSKFLFLSLAALFVLAGAYLLFGAYDASAQAGEIDANSVVFFENSNFLGRSLTVEVDQDMADLTKVSLEGTNLSWNDRISSIKIGKRVCLTIYQDINFKPTNTKKEYRANGTSQRDEPVLPNSWNDKISSLRVRAYDNCSKN